MANKIDNWVLAEAVNQDCLDRIGDAQRMADSRQGAVGVLLCFESPSDDQETSVAELIRFGADLVIFAAPAEDGGEQPQPSGQSLLADISESVSTGSSRQLDSGYRNGNVSLIEKVDATIRVLSEFPVTTVFAGGDPTSREWASLLAAKMGWTLISPALMVTCRSDRRIVTQLNHSGRKSRQIELDDGQPVVVTMKSGVAEASVPDDGRTGEIRSTVLTLNPKKRRLSKVAPANPETCDIRDTKRLVSGGRGLGSANGFDLLRKVAKRLGAGVSASRMAVDLGWIEYERQVGQTGKTVAPDVYIACGISGASHHLEGMSEAQHIIAINTDVEAPIMKKADLGLGADLHSVLREMLIQLDSRAVVEQEGAK